MLILVQGFWLCWLISMLSWLWCGWGIVGCVSLGLGVVQHLMQ